MDNARSAKIVSITQQRRSGRRLAIIGAGMIILALVILALFVALLALLTQPTHRHTIRKGDIVASVSEYVELGAVPTDEDTESGNPDRERAECRAFMGLLRRRFGAEPEGAKLAIKWYPDQAGGEYAQVVCYYHSDVSASMEYAFRMEFDTPVCWDLPARRELGLPDLEDDRELDLDPLDGPEDTEE